MAAQCKPRSKTSAPKSTTTLSLTRPICKRSTRRRSLRCERRPARRPRLFSSQRRRSPRRFQCHFWLRRWPYRYVHWRLEEHWPLDDTCYRGLVETLCGAGHVMMYEDGDGETLDLTCKTWRFSAASLVPSTASLEMPSDIPSVLCDMLEFGKKRS